MASECKECDYGALDFRDDPCLSHQERAEVTKAERHVLRISREGKIDEVKQVMKNDKYNHIDWGKVMFEAAFSVESPKSVQKKVLWILSKRYSGCSQTRQELCDSLLEIGTKHN